MDNVIRGGNWYFDTLNLWRVIEEATLPEFKFAEDAFTPAGHHMQVGWQEEMEKLQAMVKTKTADPQLQAMVGRRPGDYITATWYENLLSYRTGEERGRVIVMKGLLSSKSDAVKGHKAAGREYQFGNIVYYSDVVDAKTIHRFDFFGGPGATIVNGEAIYATMSSNLAIAGGIVL